MEEAPNVSLEYAKNEKERKLKLRQEAIELAGDILKKDKIQEWENGAKSLVQALESACGSTDREVSYETRQRKINDYDSRWKKYERQWLVVFEWRDTFMMYLKRDGKEKTKTKAEEKWNKKPTFKESLIQLRPSPKIVWQDCIAKYLIAAWKAELGCWPNFSSSLEGEYYGLDTDLLEIIFKIACIESYFLNKTPQGKKLKQGRQFLRAGTARWFASKIIAYRE